MRVLGSPKLNCRAVRYACEPYSTACRGNGPSLTMLDNFTRPSKALEETLVAHTRIPVRTLSGALPMEGGLPMVVNENVIGAIGVSGVTAQQDGQMPKAGVDALPPILGQ